MNDRLPYVVYREGAIPNTARACETEEECACVCVCACVSDGEKKCVCVCVCVRERERETKALPNEHEADGDLPHHRGAHQVIYGVDGPAGLDLLLHARLQHLHTHTHCNEHVTAHHTQGTGSVFVLCCLSLQNQDGSLGLDPK